MRKDAHTSTPASELQKSSRSDLIDWRYKAFPPTERPVSRSQLGAARWNALDGDLMFPVLLLKEEDLKHNISLMMRFCEARGCSLAPHVKTTMSPQLVRRQLDAGAWGVSVATASQARVMRATGAQRLLIANQLVDPVALRWVGDQLNRDPDLEIYCLVDSLDGVRIMEEGLRECRLRRPLPVLVELGLMGGRSGCRTLGEAMAVARAVRGTSHLRLVGVEGYEGIIHEPTTEATIKRVDGFLASLRRLTVDLAADGAFDGASEILVSAGGSAYFDRVADQLAPPWDSGKPVRVVLRPGCYVTHDHQNYDLIGPLGTRLSDWDPFRAAFEIWGMVHSRPESDLAIVGFGRRDVSFDVALPKPLYVKRRGAEKTPADGGLDVFALNDQHAYVHVDPSFDLAVGDLVACGLAHPCTIFDKWRLIPVVDGEYRVVDAVETFF